MLVTTIGELWAEQVKMLSHKLLYSVSFAFRSFFIYLIRKGESWRTKILLADGYLMLGILVSV